jgi:hypothetical protein
LLITISLDVRPESNGTALNSLNVDSLTNITLTTVVHDSRKAYSGSAQSVGYEATMLYQWTVLSSNCGGMQFSAPANQTSNVAFSALGASTVLLTSCPWVYCQHMH